MKTINSPLRTLEAIHDKIRHIKNEGSLPAKRIIINIREKEYIHILRIHLICYVLITYLYYI